MIYLQECNDRVVGIKYDFPSGMSTPLYAFGGKKNVEVQTEKLLQVDSFLDNCYSLGVLIMGEKLGIKCPECQHDNPPDTIYCGKCATPLLQTEVAPPSHTETMETPKEELTTGATFAGRYQIIEELGRGGMGKVYKAFDTEIRERVALKLITAVIAADKKTIERFRNELKLARKIRHKNVCQMYDLSKAKDNYYITMEYVPGEDLRSFMRRSEQLSVRKTISIAKQICEGLSEAHRLGVVHRDLKPGNIMIDRDGNTRIMDFGIARSIEEKGVTDTKALIGTPKYMSPEQVEGKGIDQRSDIYSLGIILFEMVTGQVPFDGDTALAIALKHKTEPAPDPKGIKATIPDDLSRVIMRCLEKEKERRYQSATEVLAELTKLDELFPTQEMDISTIRHETEILRKRYKRLFIPGIILVALAIVLIGYYLLGRFSVSGGVKWKNSIAVLPIEDLSQERNQAYLCDAMLDDIITKLSSIEGMRVAPKSAITKDEGPEKDLKKLGRELNVKNILELTLQREKDIIRVNGRLINATEGLTIESYNYEENFQGSFKIQDKMSNDIAGSLEARLVKEKLESIKKREPINVEAYEFYAIGKHYIERKYSSSDKQEDFEEGVKNYQRAIEIEPNYARVYWSLGNAYEARYFREKDKDDLELMKKNYIKAYQIDPNLAEANVGLGWMYYNLADNDKAYEFFKKAYDIDPENASVNYDIGSFLRSIGLYRQAIKFYSRAIEWEPSVPVTYELQAVCYMCLGEFKEAVKWLKKGLEFDPNNFGLHIYLALQFMMLKDYDQAKKEITISEKIKPGHPHLRQYHALMLAAKGEKEKAIELVQDSSPIRYEVTSIYSLLGMNDKAIQYIDMGIETSFEDIGDYLYCYPFLINNPYYANLREDPRFEEILKREKTKYEDKLKKYSKF